MRADFEKRVKELEALAEAKACRFEEEYEMLLNEEHDLCHGGYPADGQSRDDRLKQIHYRKKFIAEWLFDRGYWQGVP